MTDPNVNTQAEIRASVYKSALESVADRLERRDFYELCQEYRHTPLDAAQQFEAIKSYILTGALPWPSYEE